MNTIAETQRLILRELEEADLAGMFELDSDPAVHTYLGNRPVVREEQSLEIIRFVRRQYLENGVGRLAVVEKATGRFVGWSGLKLVKDIVNGRTNYFDLGYRFIPSVWGQGYATESARAVLVYGFEDLDIAVIHGAAHVDNCGSNRILQKLGFQHDGQFEYDGSQHHWYTLTKEDWTRYQTQ